MGWDGIPDVVCPPVSHLQNDFPMRPKLMGALVPHQINMWMGTAAEGWLFASMTWFCFTQRKLEVICDLEGRHLVFIMIFMTTCTS